MTLKNKIKSFFTMDDEYEYVDESSTESTYPPKEKPQNVVSLTSMQQANSKVVLCEPRSYNEAQEIADNIVNRRAVIINLQRVNHDQAKRIVDFLSGTVYAVNGNIQKLGPQTFLCAPDNIDVSGTISEAIDTGYDYKKGW